MKRSFLGGLAALIASAIAAGAASLSLLPSTSQYNEPSQIVSTLNGVIQSINNNVTPGTMGTWQSPRNFLDNGDFIVQQRGTTAVTCAANSAATTTAYGPDRWLCDANVGSGAGQMQIVTSSPTLPPGFTAEVKLWRNSGALTQPVCMMQAIPTVEATALAGQQVTLSAYLQALAGLAADNGNVINMYVFTGTGTDEKFLGTSWTASPAITPAWTGIATAGGTAQTITTSWGRYSQTVAIPATATEIAVAICFTPTANGAGATDGIAITGVQLEQGTVAGPFEFRKIADETLRAQRYFYSVTEPAANIAVGLQGQSASTTTCSLMLQYPVTMRAAPTFTAFGTALANTTWKINQAAQNLALATTYLVTLVGNSPNAALMTATTAASQTAGWGCQLVGAAGGSILTWSADL